MKKIIYISNTLMLLAMLVFSTSGSVQAQGQCNAGGCTFGGTQYPSGTFSNPGAAFVTVSGGIFGGEYQLYSVVSGNQYEWSYCTGDGAADALGEDLQLTLFNEATTTQICYSDDYCGVAPKIQWTATFTGIVRVLTNQFSCATNSTFHTLVWRQSAGGGGGVANDDCATAIPITCSSVTVGTTVGAVADASPACGGSPSAPGVWYSFVGNGQNMLASLCTGTAYDTRLAVYSGTCGALTCVIENDDNCGLQSAVTFPSVAGTTYYILVNGFGSNTGAFTLTMAPAVTNDVCATATTITPGTYTGSTVCTGNDVVTTCGTTDGTGGGVWYQVTGTNTCSSFTASLCTGTNYDSKIRVFEGTCGALTCVTGVDDNCGGNLSTVTWNYVAGTTYYILVHGYSSAEGSFTLNLSQTTTDATAPVLNGGGGPGTVDVAALTNNTCMATFSQADLAQSFIPVQNSICGASLGLTSAGTGNVTISLYTNLPNAGGVMLGSGTVVLDGITTTALVSWPTVNVTPGVTYYLVFTGTNTGLCVGGDSGNGYANGMTFANAGYGSFPGFDYTFQTYYGCGGSIAPVTSACPVASLAIPTATDNCAGTVNGTTVTTFPISASTTVVWSFNDGNGNISTYNQTVTINDNIAPTPNAGSLADVTAECSVASLVAPTATDNCGGMVTVTNNATLPITTQGTTVVVWTYADIVGNTTTQNQNVIIDDNTAPTPNAGSLADVTAECSVASLVAPTATDNCAGMVMVTNNVTLPITAQGTTVVTWTYADMNGNSTTQSQNVIIDDNTAPTPDAMTLSDVTAECEVTTLTAPTATDNCAGMVMVSNDATLPITVQGTTVVTWTYEDMNGNSSTQLQNVIIDDNTAPTPDAMTLSDVTAECEVTSLTTPTATDNCAGVILTTNDAVLPITSNTTITWTYEDVNGNISSQTQNVLVEDLTAPVPDATLSDIASECPIDFMLEPTATDNCSGSVFGLSDAIFPISASTTITWTYEDASGNISTQTQNVVINDGTAPVPNEAALETITATCEVISLSIPKATDNCVGLVDGTYDVVLPITASTTITWSYEDANGNISTQTQEVIITGVDATVTVADPTITANNTNAGVTYQWVDCDNNNEPIVDETGVSFTPTVTGNYAVIVTDGNCSEMSPCNVIEVGGINVFSAELMNIYPNPATDVLFIQTSQNGNLELLDLNGKVIFKGSVLVGENKISVATIATGTYTVRLTSGTTVQTVRLVINRQ